MIDSILKDAWATLTVVIPGLVTYGSWRLLMLFGGGSGIDTSLLTQVDDSALLSASLIAAIAIVQQAAAITLEAVLSILSFLAGRSGKRWQQLLLRRFRIAAHAPLSEDARRVIAQFFLSLNVLVGQGGVLLYFLLVESHPATSAIPLLLYCVLALVFVACAFRAWAASQVLP